MGLKFNKVDFRETKQSWSNFDLRWIQLFFYQTLLFSTKVIVVQNLGDIELVQGQAAVRTKSRPAGELSSGSEGMRGPGRLDKQRNRLIDPPSPPLPSPHQPLEQS